MYEYFKKKYFYLEYYIFSPIFKFAIKTYIASDFFFFYFQIVM